MKSEWIPVTDRMPEEWQDVLVFCSDGNVMIAEYVDGWQESRECIPLDDVTHWMPLPEPPENAET